MRAHEIRLEPNGATLTGFTYEKSVTIPESGAKPTALVFPGGGYMRCVYNEGDPIAMAFLHEGFNAFVLYYSVTEDDTPGSPQKPKEEVFDCALADAVSAIRYLREHAEELCLDPDRIVTVGFSAGANLAAAMNLMTETRSNAMILGYGAYDSQLRNRQGTKAPDLLNMDMKDAPPTFLFATQYDAFVPAVNTIKMAARFMENGIPCESHVFVSGDHALALATHATGDENRDVAQWFPMSIRFLKHVWSGKNLLWGDLADAPPTIESRDDILIANPAVKAILEELVPEHTEKMVSTHFYRNINFRRYAAVTHIPESMLQMIERRIKDLR